MHGMQNWNEIEDDDDVKALLVTASVCNAF